MKNFPALLEERMRIAIIQLWLYEEFRELNLREVDEPHEVIRSLIDMLNQGLLNQDNKVGSYLIDLIESIRKMDIDDKSEFHEMKLSEMLGILLINHIQISDKHKLNAMKPCVISIMKKISSITSFEEARADLWRIDKMSMVAAHLAFAGNARLEGFWDNIVRDFEHSDEEIVLRSIYDEIRNGNYV